MAISREQQLANLRAAQAAQPKARMSEGSYMMGTSEDIPALPPEENLDIKLGRQQDSQQAQQYANIFKQAFQQAGTSPFQQGKPLELLRQGGSGAPTPYLSGPDSPYEFPVTEAAAGMADKQKPWMASEAPVGNMDARNAAQFADARSKAAQENYKLAVEAAQGISGAAKKGAAALGYTATTDASGRTSLGGQDLAAAGFNRERGRAYNVERSAAGDIIGMRAIQKAGEDTTREDLASKGWSAAGSKGGAGSPFTPSLDKFKAVQNPEALVHSWDKPDSPTAGMTAMQQADVRRLTREATGGRSTVGRVTGATTTQNDEFGGMSTNTVKPSSITSDQRAVAGQAQAQSAAVNRNAGEFAGQVIGGETKPASMDLKTQMQKAQAAQTLGSKWDKAEKQGENIIRSQAAADEKKKKQTPKV